VDSWQASRRSRPARLREAELQRQLPRGDFFLGRECRRAVGDGDFSGAPNWWGPQASPLFFVMQRGSLLETALDSRVHC
jgi:hypothetical protein